MTISNNYAALGSLLAQIFDDTESTGSQDLGNSEFGDGYSEAFTDAYRAGQERANQAAIDAFNTQTDDAIESLKQQTMAKQMNSAIRNGNLINY